MAGPQTSPGLTLSFYLQGASEAKQVEPHRGAAVLSCTCSHFSMSHMLCPPCQPASLGPSSLRCCPPFFKAASTNILPRTPCYHSNACLWDSCPVPSPSCAPNPSVPQDCMLQDARWTEFAGSFAPTSEHSEAFSWCSVHTGWENRCQESDLGF